MLPAATLAPALASDSVIETDSALHLTAYFCAGVTSNKLYVGRAQFLLQVHDSEQIFLANKSEISKTLCNQLFESFIVFFSCRSSIDNSNKFVSLSTYHS